MNAIALNSAAFTFTGILGPALAAVLIAVPAVDLAQIYFLMTVCYLAVVLMILRIPGGDPIARRDTRHPVRELLDGLAYVRRHPTLPYILLMGFVPIVIAMPYRQFFPVFQEEVYKVSEDWVGIMGAAMAVGAFAGALVVASLTDTSRKSIIQIMLGLSFGAGLVLFGAAPSVWFGIGALVFVGFASNAYWSLNSTLVLSSSEPEFYGRVMSVYMISWAINPFAGYPESVIADAFGVQWLIGGVGIVLVCALIAIFVFLPGHRKMEDQRVAALAD
jgi:MFS family permease